MTRGHFVNGFAPRSLLLVLAATAARVPPCSDFRLTTLTTVWAQIVIAGRSLGGQGGRHLKAMLKVVAKWSPSDDDLIWLRRSLGIHANEADIEYLPAEMVKAYQDTHYAKVRASPALSLAFSAKP